MSPSFIKFVICILSLCSMGAAISVWLDVSTSFIEQFFLVFAAIGLDLAKVIVIYTAYMMYKNNDALQFVVALFAVILVVISIGTMYSFFDQKITLHTDIAQIAQRNQQIADHAIERNRKIDTATIDATTKYVNQGNVTLNGLQKLQKLQQIAPTAITAIPRNTHTSDYSVLLAAIGAMSAQRVAIQCAISAIIDIALIALLLSLHVNVQSRQTNCAPTTVQPTPPKRPKNAPVDELDNVFNIDQYIDDLPANEPLVVTQLMKLSGLRHPQISKILQQKVDEGLVKKTAKSYIKAPSLHAIQTG